MDKYNLRTPLIKTHQEEWGAKQERPASPRCQSLFLTEVCETQTDNSWECRKGVNQTAVIHAPRKL